jgi:outer membrane immunogenic protein
MIKRSIVLSALASVAMFGSAHAADLGAPVYKAPPVFPMWAGLYVGGFVGGAWDNMKATDFDEFGPPAISWHNKGSAVFGGGTIGYNAQAGSWVYGVEADIGAFGLRHSAEEFPGAGIFSSVGRAFYFDTTLRLGYAFDKFLVYGKGGAAFHDGDWTVTDVGEASTTKSGILGYTVGAGIEYKIAPNWSVKAEYQYFNFGKEHLVMPSDGDRYDLNYNIHTLKAGVNYHF